MKPMKAYDAEYREIIPPKRDHKSGHGDWEQVVVIAPNFDEASILAQDYGKKNFPKMVLVSVELHNDKVAM